MKALIDSDILLYEVGYGSQHKDEETGELVVNSFDQAAQLLDEKVKQIEAEVWATEPSTLYLTGDSKLFESINRALKRKHKEVLPYKENFRKAIATTKVYKGQRKQEKPFHYYNIREYILANYDTVVSNGMEADDMLSVDLYRSHLDGSLDVICCSRDKDLKMVPGLHFSWECGKQPQWGPHRVTGLGEISLSKNKKKIIAEGLLAFYAQMLTGDVVDNIGGCKKAGPVAAYDLLTTCEPFNEYGLFTVVKDRFMKAYGDDWEKVFMENANLLWMVRELNEDGTPVLFRMPAETGLAKEEGRTNTV